MVGHLVAFLPPPPAPAARSCPITQSAGGLAAARAVRGSTQVVTSLSTAARSPLAGRPVTRRACTRPRPAANPCSSSRRSFARRLPGESERLLHMYCVGTYLPPDPLISGCICLCRRPRRGCYCVTIAGLLTALTAVSSRATGQPFGLQTGNSSVVPRRRTAPH
ncbi:hypothetical protein BDY21DRAFT_333028 [Lineolata rhizophorae]|uniref:Uncharacterized protein n=1 Tax=Lineolata rhizophorae TaxID=578093 RepID=A0A6A6PCK3_9PEZI|nr:hypothetical protein BDY21DRAFT_333028 [Lineolata rhizophorae]